ncbi:hypothetical protein FRC11_006005, partial [Ceratobasidium sp. 423]
AEPKFNVASFPTIPSDPPGSRNLFGDHKADDIIRVSSSGHQDQLIQDCPNSELLATLAVPSETKFTLEELLILTMVVSDYQPNYHLLQSQCYWYAFTVWHLMKTLCPSAVQSPTALNNSASHSRVPWIEWHTREGHLIDAPTQVRANVENVSSTLVPLYCQAWDKFQADLQLFKQSGEQAHIKLAQQAENEAQRAESEARHTDNETPHAENEAQHADEASRQADHMGEEIARLRKRVLELEKRLADENHT